MCKGACNFEAKALPPNSLCKVLEMCNDHIIYFRGFESGPAQQWIDSDKDPGEDVPTSRSAVTAPKNKMITL